MIKLKEHSLHWHDTNNAGMLSHLGIVCTKENFGELKQHILKDQEDAEKFRDMERILEKDPYYAIIVEEYAKMKREDK